MSKRRRWLLAKALESNASLADALELAKQTDEWFGEEKEWPKEHAPAAPAKGANGSMTHEASNFAELVKTVTKGK